MGNSDFEKPQGTPSTLGVSAFHDPASKSKPLMGGDLSAALWFCVGLGFAVSIRIYKLRQDLLLLCKFWLSKMTAGGPISVVSDCS